MAKSKQEINPKSAIRLKQLYEEHGITQVWLSDKTGISQNTLSRIANGKTALSYTIACEIVKVVPDISVEWLMGTSDFPTDMLKSAFPAFKSLYFKIKNEKAVLAFLKTFGITIEAIVSPDIGNISTEEFFCLPESKQKDILAATFEEWGSEQYFMIKKSDGEVVKRISGAEKERFIEDICDYVEFKFDKLTEEKT